MAGKKKAAGDDEKPKDEAKAKKSEDKPGEPAKAEDESKPKAEPKAEASVAGRLPILMLVEIVVAVGVLVLLRSVVHIHWLGALSIASALFVFLDAAIHHVNRIKPSSKESRLGLLVWSLVGFVPFAGVAAYAVLRKKLASAPVAKVTSGKEAVETVKSRMRMVPIPTAVVVGVIAVAIAWLSLPGPFTITFGTNYTRALVVEGTTSGNVYTVGTVAVKLETSKPIEGYANLDWKLHLGGSDTPIYKGTVKVHPESAKDIWVWKVRARHPGEYRIDVIDNTGEVVKRGYFTAIPKLR